MENPFSLNNRKAYFEFEILDKYIAGIQLTGTEIKSVRQGKVNLNDSFCFFRQGELYIKNMYISEYKQASFYTHEPKRDRKLLLTKVELRKLSAKMEEKGLTLVPLRLFINDRSLAKLEIGLAKGKKLHDKRESIKEKDIKREMARRED